MGDQKPFRVIIVGGGVGGLAAAHAFEKANIDHVVLEKGEIAPARGASIGIYPHGARILQQFGTLKAVDDETYPIEKAKDLLPDGTVFANSDLFKFLRQYHGYPIPVLERRRFLEIMYEALSDKSAVKPHTEVVDIIDSEDGVKVVLADGGIEEGDLVLGVDGVHSLVRSLMWRNANTAVPGMITANEKKSLYADYSLLIGFSETKAEMSQSDLTCTHYPGKSFLVIGGKKHTFWFVFFKNERVHWPALPRWTKADAERRAAECMDCPISETQVFGELWKTAIRTELVNVEEGLFKHMFFGRVVLAGDAVHKMTPNIGLGGNSAMESIVVLTNLLNKAIKEHPQGKPDRAALQSLLTEYQKERQVRMRQFIDFSSLATKTQAWENLWYKILSRVIPFLPDDTFAKQASALFKAAPKLDFVPVPGNLKGTVKWDDEVLEIKNRKVISAPSLGEWTQSMLRWTVKPILSLCVMLSFLFVVRGSKASEVTESA
ncbi:FAD-dependent monooxygenase, putative [Talaromyces stipitatus ATCC 10500]|uniref:FAD-dependent monooxygenase, putative n=1 Tax=Talaromyces stipitatus (strain ATCC 10500 / CBS 375.48 / QM 6759 / NRRL 1006) TaxID=441959 RepID=B8M7V6_TALSN|nr:FAD-dependent monooxygenase, putative [Talaromyces stipitatus ATCC 10500]EED19835.1 FAD-dependent monooxygenase, putative [Talaromyces stipitatus ATCC 10500]